MRSTFAHRISVTIGSTVAATALAVLVAGDLGTSTDAALIRTASGVASSAHDTDAAAVATDPVAVTPSFGTTGFTPTAAPTTTEAADPATTTTTTTKSTPTTAATATPATTAATRPVSTTPPAPTRSVATTPDPAPAAAPARTAPPTPTTAPPPPPSTTTTTAAPAPQPPARSSTTVACEADMVRWINDARAAAGLPALANDGGLASVPIRWSERMASKQSLAHNPDYADQIFAARGQATRVSENVGYGAGSNRALFDAFMDSSGHRANILGKYTNVTVGCAHDADGKVWATMNFWA